jgi:hypothetical protein
MTGWESNGVAFPAPTASLYSRTDQGPASWSVEMAVRRCTSITTLRSYGGIRTLLLESIRSCFLRKALISMARVTWASPLLALCDFAKRDLAGPS